METEQNELDYYIMDYTRCKTKEDFIALLRVLAKDFVNNRHEWENLEINDFLDAMARSCEDSPYMKAGDPFVKDQKFIENLKPFVEKYQERVVETRDKEGNEIRLFDFTSWIQPESPWSILARIFCTGKSYE